jgi:hypothetical protein
MPKSNMPLDKEPNAKYLKAASFEIILLFIKLHKIYKIILKVSIHIYVKKKSKELIKLNNKKIDIQINQGSSNITFFLLILNAISTKIKKNIVKSTIKIFILNVKNEDNQQ